MKKGLFSLSAPGAVAFMAATNTITNHMANRNVIIPSDHVHYYRTKHGNVAYLKFSPKQSAQTQDGSEHLIKCPLILIHDLYPGFSAEEWRKTAERFSQNRVVYALDLPGCGRSDKPKISYTRYFYVQLLNHFVRDISGNGVDIISSGGSFATVILADRMNPDAFRRIIAVNPPPVAAYKSYPSYLQTLLRSVLRSPILGTYLYNMHFSRTATTDRLLQTGFYNPSKLSPEFAKLVYQSAHYDYQQAKYLFAGLASRYLNLDITESLRLYSKKLYFVMGSAYPDLYKIYASYQEQVSRAGLSVIGGTAKYPHLEKTEKFCSIIERL